nr:rho crystallin-like isoform X1 [Danaus plexippus plexippus]
MVLNKVIMLGNIRRNCKNEKGCTRSFLQRFIDLICLEYVFCSGCCLKGGNGSQEKTWCMKSTENAKRKPGGKKSRNFTTESVNAMEVKAVLKLKESGRVRHVGVSNVNEEQLIRLTAVEKPACLQVEVHVLFQQKSLIAAANRLGIPVVAYSPLGSRALTNMLAAKTGRNYPHLLELPLVLELSKKYSRTPAQILLRFLLQHGVGAIPKSTDPTRIKQNISLWDFELNDTEMQDLHNLDRGEEGRICDFGFFIGVQTHPEFPFKKN